MLYIPMFEQMNMIIYVNFFLHSTWTNALLHSIDATNNTVGIKGHILKKSPNSSYVRWFRNSKEVFFSKFLTAFFAFTKFFFSYLCKVLKLIRCTYTDHVM